MQSWRRWCKALANFLALTADEESPPEIDEVDGELLDDSTAVQVQSAKKATPKCYSCGIMSSWPDPGPAVALSLHEGNRWYCQQCGAQQSTIPLHQLPGDMWPMPLKAKLAFPPHDVQDWVRYRRKVDNVGKARFNIALPAYECRLCGKWHKGLPHDTPPCSGAQSN